MDDSTISSAQGYYSSATSTSTYLSRGSLEGDFWQCLQCFCMNYDCEAPKCATCGFKQPTDEIGLPLAALERLEAAAQGMPALSTISVNNLRPGCVLKASDTPYLPHEDPLKAQLTDEDSLKKSLWPRGSSTSTDSESILSSEPGQFGLPPRLDRKLSPGASEYYPNPLFYVCMPLSAYYSQCQLQNDPAIAAQLPYFLGPPALSLDPGAVNANLPQGSRLGNNV